MSYSATRFSLVFCLTDVFALSTLLNSTAVAAVFVNTELGPRVNLIFGYHPVLLYFLCLFCFTPGSLMP